MDTKQNDPKLTGMGGRGQEDSSSVVRLHGRRRQQRSLKGSHKEVQLTEGTAMAATESTFVLDDVADVLQLLVAQTALMEPAKGKSGKLQTLLSGSALSS